MIIDILFLIAIVWAVYKGFTKGFIIGLFSFIAYYIGLAAALKLSSIVADHFTGNEKPSFWMPVLSFLLVFVVVVIAVNLLARLIRSMFSLASLGWMDRIAGIVLFIAIYLFIFSILLFYATKTSLLGGDAIAGSRVYPFISPMGPAMVDFLGKLLPFFKDMFTELQDFFQSSGENFKAFLLPMKY